VCPDDFLIIDVFICFVCTQVDLFALGMVVYELVSGHSCHGNSSVLQIIRYLDEGKDPLVCCHPFLIAAKIRHPCICT
jgi:hypothetical protein